MNAHPTFAEARNTPIPFAIGGRTFLIAEHVLDDEAEIERWAQSRIPNPLERLRDQVKIFPLEIAVEIARDQFPKASAEARAWPPHYGGTAINAELRTAEGLIFAFLTAAKRHQVITEPEVRVLCRDAALIPGIIKAVNYWLNGPAALEPSDPELATMTGVPYDPKAETAPAA